MRVSLLSIYLPRIYLETKGSMMYKNIFLITALLIVSSLYSDGIISPAETLVCSSKLYTAEINDTLDERLTYDASKKLYRNDPVPWLDIIDFINLKHRTKGFIDLYLTVVSKNSLTEADNELQWKMYKDGDTRDDYDLRANADGVLVDMIDPNRKGKESYSDDGYSGSGLTNGQYLTFRFAVPYLLKNHYNMYIGRYNIRSQDDEQGDAESYQVLIYTPKVSDLLIPHVELITPQTAGVFIADYDSVRKIKKVPVKQWQVVVNTPVQFSGASSFNKTDEEIIEYKWEFSDAYGPIYGETASRVF
jgi:hypothetical protein